MVVNNRREGDVEEDADLGRHRTRGRAKKRGARRQRDPDEAAYPENIEVIEANNRADEDSMFMDPSAFEKTSSRYTSAVDAKHQISGCLFGFLGLIVLGFATWLIHAGRVSQRQEEIISYAKAVKEWTNTHRSEFEKLTFAVRPANASGVSTPVPLIKGNKTAEWDVRHALGRTQGERNPLRKERFEERLENDFYYRKQGAGGRRLMEDIAELSDDELIIDYMPLKHELSFSPTK